MISNISKQNRCLLSEVTFMFDFALFLTSCLQLIRVLSDCNNICLTSPAFCTSHIYCFISPLAHYIGIFSTLRLPPNPTPPRPVCFLWQIIGRGKGHVRQYFTAAHPRRNSLLSSPSGRTSYNSPRAPVIHHSRSRATGRKRRER